MRPHLRGGVTVEGDRQGRQGASGVGDDGGRGIRDRALGHHKGGPRFQGRRDEFGAVAFEAGDRDEGEAGPDAARVVGDARHACYARGEADAEGFGEACGIQ
jgi:hypothetical protein